MLKECAITTFDNPFNPFEQFDSWLLYDKEKGYDSNEWLARLVNITDDMSEQERNNEIERAIDRIIELDFLNIYTKVYRETT